MKTLGDFFLRNKRIVRERLNCSPGKRGQKEEMQPSINWGKQDWHQGGSVFYSTLLLISRSVQIQIRGEK